MAEAPDTRKTADMTEPGRDGLLLLPHIPGTEHSFSQDILCSFYERMREEGTADVVFMDGLIKNPNDWLELIDNSYFFAVTHQGKPGLLVWLNRPQCKWVQLGFVAFKWTWGKLTVRMGLFAQQELITMRDEAGYLWDAFLGIIPASNHLACKFRQCLGWKEIGIFPNGIYNAKTGQSETATLSYFDRSCL